MVNLSLVFDGSQLIIPIILVCGGVFVYLSGLAISRIIDSFNNRKKFKVDGLHLMPLGSDLKDIESEVKKVVVKKKQIKKEIKEKSLTVKQIHDNIANLDKVVLQPVKVESVNDMLSKTYKKVKKEDKVKVFK